MFGPETCGYFTTDDRYMINLPLFHMGGTALAFCMMTHHASISMVESFNTDRFWPAIRETGTTAVFLLGVMATFVEARPPAPDDRDHPLRFVHMVPIVDDIHRFSDRFGVDVYTVYNMTEISTPIASGPNPGIPGTCGRMREGVEVRLLDENDCEVVVGHVGEFCVRTDAPWAMNHGYYKNPEATARAWRNGWFHTGDAGMRDADGNFFFVDRIKDAIRRRGENISSLEVEIEITAHPVIREAAVIPVPSDLAEDEVMAVVSVAPGETLDPVELLEFLQPRMAHFMIPRFLRIVDDLPKTPTAKVQKHLLRDEGVTDDTWDRETAGIRTKRDRIGN
jgi:crotonobetaine/carnitine-CoA ligase